MFKVRSANERTKKLRTLSSCFQLKSLSNGQVRWTHVERIVEIRNAGFSFFEVCEALRATYRQQQEWKWLEVPSIRQCATLSYRIHRSTNV